MFLNYFWVFIVNFILCYTSDKYCIWIVSGFLQVFVYSPDHSCIIYELFVSGILVVYNLFVFWVFIYYYFCYFFFNYHYLFVCGVYYLEFFLYYFWTYLLYLMLSFGLLLINIKIIKYFLFSFFQIIIKIFILNNWKLFFRHQNFNIFKTI